MKPRGFEVTPTQTHFWLGGIFVFTFVCVLSHSVFGLGGWGGAVEWSLEALSAGGRAACKKSQEYTVQSASSCTSLDKTAP